MLTYDEAQMMMATTRKDRRKLGNNTYLYLHSVANGRHHYAVRYHYTDVVIIHPDGSYTLANGGWNTVTTNVRLNAYSPARVSGANGILCVWHDSDPRTPAWLSKCRTCHGSGQRGSTGYTDWQGTVHPDLTYDCYRCAGSGQCDYGSKPNPVLFYDGITVSGTGMVIGPAQRLIESDAEREARLAAEKAADEARQAAELAELAARTADWLAARKIDDKRPVLFKACQSTPLGRGGRSYHDAFYMPGETTTADDYRADDQCGHGLHFSPTVVEAKAYDTSADIYFACEVDRATLIPLGDDKCKARSCKVLYQVDIHGNRIMVTD